MDSAVSQTLPPKSPHASRRRVLLERWNRKLHYYSGLFFIFFIWLFAFSGLLLNHASWTADFWTNRKETTHDHVITPLGADVLGDLAQARDIMKQLNIDGEILWTVTRVDPNQFEFQVRRPGYYFFIKTDFAQKRANVRQDKVI